VLVIRAEQMSVLADWVERRFDLDFQRFVKERLPRAEALHGGELASRIDAAIGRATPRGIERFDHLLLFVGMELLVAERYFEIDESGSIRPVLDDPRFDAETRMEVVRSRLEAARAVPDDLAALLAEGGQ
jgi:hypothetical protein